MNAKHLIVLVGPPGAGKTSLARSYIDQGYSYVNGDSQGKEGHWRAFNEALAIDAPGIVIDRMSFDRKQRSRFLDPAKAKGYSTEIIVLHESRATCLSRCLARTGHETVKTDADAQKAIGFFFRSYERPTADEADKIDFRYPFVSKYSTCIVVDLDGTLCNIDHRLHFVKSERKDWRRFFLGLSDDMPNQWCLDIIHNYPSPVILCSGRPEEYRGLTEAWLKQNGVGYASLVMRHSGDHRRDDVAKEILLDFEILTTAEPVMFVDDRQQVIDLWRRRGFVALQCARGDF